MSAQVSASRASSSGLGNIRVEVEPGFEVDLEQSRSKQAGGSSGRGRPRRGASDCNQHRCRQGSLRLGGTRRRGMCIAGNGGGAGGRALYDGEQKRGQGAEGPASKPGGTGGVDLKAMEAGMQLAPQHPQAQADSHSPMENSNEQVPRSCGSGSA
ncbi:uncharacterized protein PSFLO_01306 [Pseudozyma flocculosa]|uniref:Uncharacterized protein n=1 Tax=Pseudozyma flocculosa TaxID=84751 RepID=A0A5C3EVQ9_9BASI|nr:uncharacterized protein PSFLO_01306 [Pseudozyma flocculosa]